MDCYLYLGSYGNARGIHLYRFSEEDGRAEKIGSAFPQVNVGHMLYDARRGVLYVANQADRNPGFSFGGGGEIFALSVGEGGKLALFDHTPSYGVFPAYLALDRTGSRLVVTHYTPPFSVATRVKRDENGKVQIEPVLSDSTTALLGLRENGGFEGALDVFCHELSPEAEENPHLHSVNLSPLWDLFAVCDMGSDEIYLFKAADDRLTPAESSPLVLEPGVGPRYSAFHPTSPLLFIDCERSPLVKSFRYDEAGRLTPLASLSVLPRGMVPHFRYNPTGLALSADGSFLYVLVRDAELVSVVKTDARTGGLELVQSYTLAGKGPRGCALSPDGRFLAVANKGSDTAELLRVGADGLLSPSGVLEVPSPGVVTFVRK